MTKTERSYAIIGGTSGMGFGVAERLVERGDRVLLGGRSSERLGQACERLGPSATGRVVDAGDRASIQAFFSDPGPLAGMFTPGSVHRSVSFREDSAEVVEDVFRAKLLGQYWAVHAALPHLTPQASVVLMSGAASARPLGAPAYASCNAALEGLARALASELSPIRVNCFSPGIIDSELWRNRPEDVRASALERWKRLSVRGEFGSVDEAADAVLFLLDNGNMTGNTLFLDGGFTLR